MGKEGSLFTENSINNVLAQTNIEFVLAYTAPLPSKLIFMAFNNLLQVCMSESNVVYCLKAVLFRQTFLLSSMLILIFTCGLGVI